MKKREIEPRNKLKADGPPLKTNLSIIWTLVKKNITLYIKSGPVLIFGLMFPFFLTLSWIIGRDIGALQIFIGIVAMTSFFTATAISPVILSIETRENSLERVISAPVGLIHILFGIMLASFIYSSCITLIITVTFLLVLQIPLSSLISLIIMILAIIFMGLIGSLIGLLASAHPTEKTSDVMVIINMVKFPLIFISGIFIPFESLPPNVLILSFISPLTFMVDLLRLAINENNYFPLFIDLLASLSWIVGLLVINFLAHKRTLLKRFSGSQKKMKPKK